jgi:hypothetical protein
MTTFTRSRLITANNKTQRELNWLCRYLQISNINRLFAILSVKHNGYRWTRETKGIGSPYGLRLMHLLRLHNGDAARGIPSRFADSGYDWEAHWYHWDKGVDVARDYYKLSDRYGGRA